MNIRVIFKYLDSWSCLWCISSMLSNFHKDETNRLKDFLRGFLSCYQRDFQLVKGEISLKEDSFENPEGSLHLPRTAPKVCLILQQRNNRSKNYVNEIECILKMHIRPHYITIIAFHSWHDPYAEWKSFMLCCVPFVFAVVIGIVAYIYAFHKREKLIENSLVSGASGGVECRLLSRAFGRKSIFFLNIKCKFEWICRKA